MVPQIWELPREIRARLSGKAGGQRALAHDEHLLLVLHEAPSEKNNHRKCIYFWRDPNGEWSNSGRAGELATMRYMVERYAELAEELESAQEEASSAEAHYRLLELAAPLHRAARNFHDTLAHAIQSMDCAELHEELQAYCDQMAATARTAELVQMDAKHSIDFLVAREARNQSIINRQQALSAHRLNILAAVFLPMGTIAAVFGMNLHHGFEHYPSWVFWLVLVAGMIVGVGISSFVLGFRSSNFEALVDLDN